MERTARADRIASTVIAQFDKLPTKSKPTVRDNGAHEWVPLSGIVAEHDGVLSCIALATGMKCLPAAKLADARGNGLHDWHAEILAVRALNRLLLDECLSLAQGADGARLVQWAARVPGPDGARPFRFRDGVRLHMYCSEAPCGDASMELTMAAQPDASPWLPQAAPSADEASHTALPGRAYFSHLGIVRRKPSRADAPPTFSKSCSDKLALAQCSSLLSSLTALFLPPEPAAYLHSLVLPLSRYAPAACRRAFAPDGRMAAVVDASWDSGYAFRPFAVETTSVEFQFARESVRARSLSAAVSVAAIAPCNLALVWSASGVDENLIGGVLRGRKPGHPKAASRLSRRQMWAIASHLASSLDAQNVDIAMQLDKPTYAQLKSAPLLADRRAVKSQVRQTVMAGWVASMDDSEFGRQCGLIG